MKKQMKETRSLKINNIMKYICIFIVMLMLTSCNCKKDKGHNHLLIHIDKVEATCTTEGVLEHYKCTSCGKYFLDELGETEIKDISISKLGHNYDMSNIKWEWSKNYEEVVTTLICKNDKAHQEKIQAVVTKEENADAVTYKATITYNNLEYTDIKRETSVLEYELSQDETSYIVTGIGKCKDSNIIIPSEYYGLPVKSIKHDAFRGCSNLTSITIPNSVTSIGYSAFNSCSNLTSITIPNSVTSIGRYAFYSCSNLTSITIPNSVTSIGSYAFYSCSNLTSITISNSVTSIGSYAFALCHNLTSITIPNRVTSIGSYAFFNCNSLTSITIPNRVTSIESYAFAYCYNLTSITIPNSVTSIESSAFYSCIRLTIYCEVTSKPSGWSSIWNKSNRPVYYGINENNYLEQEGIIYIVKYNSAIVTGITNKISNDVTIPKEITINDITYLVTSIGRYAFYGYNSLTSITIPNSVTSIGSYALSDCYNLISITIPNSVISIENYAFAYCYNLISITIPNSVISIESYAFADCKRLTIYCEVTSKPSGWSSSWNESNRPVVWG